MIHPTQVATVVIAAMLFTGAVDAGLDPAAAGPIPAPSETAATAPKVPTPAAGAKSRARAVTAETATAAAPPSAADQPAATAPPRGRGYVRPRPVYEAHDGRHGLSQHDGVPQTKIERRERANAKLLPKIAQRGTPPGKGGGEAVPFRYVVPANAEIELWDSGMPVVT